MIKAAVFIQILKSRMSGQIEHMFKLKIKLGRDILNKKIMNPKLYNQPENHQKI